MTCHLTVWPRVSFTLCVVLLSAYSGTARAGMILVVEDKSVQSIPDATVNGFFDVFLSVSGDNPAVAGYQLRLDLAPADAGVALGVPMRTDASPPLRQPLFPTAPTDLGSTVSRVQATDFLAAGDKRAVDQDGLLRIPFSVAPNASGTYNLSIYMGDTALADASGSPIPFQAVDGRLTVVPVPEPPTLGDVNQDGELNGLDVDPFVDVLVSGTDDNVTRVLADMTGDGVVNGLDVAPFVAAVVRGGTQQVPEPSTLLLCLIATCVIGAWRKWGV